MEGMAIKLQTTAMTTKLYEAVDKCMIKIFLLKLFVSQISSIPLKCLTERHAMHS